MGIGTSLPSAPLSVVAASGAVPALGAASSHAAIGSGGFGTMIGTKSTGAGYIQQQRFDGTAAAYSLALQPNGGNVGIGTTSPQALVDVTSAIGSTRMTGHQIFLTRNGNNEIYAQGAASVLALGTNSTERMRIDSSGRVGIGTSSVDSLLHLSKASGGSVIRLENPDVGLSASEVVGRIEFETKDTGGAGVNSYIQAVGQGTGGANKLEFGTGTSNSPATRMTIDTSGNVGIGASSIDYQASNRTVVHIEGSAGALLAMEDTGAKSYLFQTGNDLLIENDTSAGSIIFGTNASTERMRIDSSGNLLVGTTD